jgi:hypothetical protein
METKGLNKAYDQIVAKIQALDLAPIKFKLMDTEEGHGWSREYADHVEIEYKRFLTLLVKYPEAAIAPSKTVDKFWHGHILDTMKYAEDCNQVFGYFLHHFPYFGMRGKEDAANLAAAAETMNRLYQQEFGEARPVQESGATTAISYCGAVAGEENRAASRKSSYCGATAAVSYCGAVAGEDHRAMPEQVSYCGIANAGSYCGAVAGKDAQSASEQISYCGAATFGNAPSGMSRESVLNTAVRPTLPPSVAK